MKVLVTGGAGFIGSNFLSRLVVQQPNVQFVNLDKLTYAANLLSLKEIESAKNYAFDRVDITDAGAVKGAFERHQPDVIVHFAAESHVDRSISGPGEFIRTNINGTFELLEAARSLKSLSLFHHVSTDEVYGSLGPTGFFTEETKYDPSSPYSASKASSDHLVRAYARTYKMPIKITNCSNNYGPKQFPEKLIPLMIMNALERKPLPIYGKGENVRDWLYVDDHCDAIWTVIERGRVGETYNVGGGAEMKNIDVVGEICSIVAAETGAAVGELLNLRKFVTDRPGHDLRYAIDSSKLRNECGWEPKETFESGIRKTVRWYLANREWVTAVQTGEYRRWMEQQYGAGK